MAVRIKKSIGKTGLADVRILKKGVIVHFEDGDAYELPLEAWDTDHKAGKYMVTLSQDNSKFIRVGPVPGTYIVQVKRFSNRGTLDIPSSRIQRGGTYPRRDGKGTFTTSDKVVFDVELEVMGDGQYDGLPINYSLDYAFAPAASGPYADIVATKASVEKLERFFRSAAGANLAVLEIPFSDNVLPWVEKYMLAHRKPFSVTTNDKGYVDTVAELPDNLFAPKATRKAKKG